MRGGRPVLSVMTMSHPQSYEILLVPAFTDGKGAADKAADKTPAADAQAAAGTDAGVGTNPSGPEDSLSTNAGAGDRGPETQGAAPEDSGSRAAGSLRPGTAIRSAIVAATGETGESGYPRYAGDGMVADIDPATHTVEALLIDGSELDYGLSVRVSERNVNG